MLSSSVYVAAASPDPEPQGKPRGGDPSAQPGVWPAWPDPVRRRGDTAFAHGGLTRGRAQNFPPGRGPPTQRSHTGSGGRRRRLARDAGTRTWTGNVLLGTGAGVATREGADVPGPPYPLPFGFILDFAGSWAAAVVSSRDSVPRGCRGSCGGAGVRGWGGGVGRRAPHVLPIRSCVRAGRWKGSLASQTGSFFSLGSETQFAGLRNRTLK